MAKQKIDPTEKEYTEAIEKSRREKIVLKLYVAGMNRLARKAIANVKRICDEELPGRCELEVIDIYKNPKLAKGEQIISTPTLIKKLPPPLRKLIGDMADKEKFLVGIDVRSAS